MDCLNTVGLSERVIDKPCPVTRSLTRRNADRHSCLKWESKSRFQERTIHAATVIGTFIMTRLVISQSLQLLVESKGFWRLWISQNHWVSGICLPFEIIMNCKTQHTKNRQIPWPESASELYRPSDHRLSVKPVPTLADRGCHVVSVTDPYGRILGFLDRNCKTQRFGNWIFFPLQVRKGRHLLCWVS
jgi:hypothetical protein